MVQHNSYFSNISETVPPARTGLARIIPAAVREFGLYVVFAGLIFLATMGLVFAEGGSTPAFPSGISQGASQNQSNQADGQATGQTQVGGQENAPIAGGGKAQQPGLFGMLGPFLLMFGVIYFLMIRPQQKRAKEHQGLIKALKKGDEVVTSSGILGTIRGITDKVVTLEIATNVKIKVLKAQVSQVVKGQQDLA